MYSSSSGSIALIFTSLNGLFVCCAYPLFTGNRTVSGWLQLRSSHSRSDGRVRCCREGGVASRCGVSLPNASLPLHPISALPSAPFPESGGGVVTCLQCVSLSFSSSTPRPSWCLPGGGSGGVGEKALVVQVHAAAAAPPVPPPSRAPVNLLKDSMIYPAPFNHPRPRTREGGAQAVQVQTFTQQ